MNRTLLLIFALFSLILSTAAHASEETLCGNEEIMIASCQIDEKKKRVLSICSSVDKKTINYRFGTGSRAEMNVVFSQKNRMSRWVDSWTDTTYFGFRVGEYSYVFAVPQEKYGVKAYLDLTKGGKFISSSECISNSFGEKNLINKAIAEISDESVRDNNFLFPK